MSAGFNFPEFIPVNMPIREIAYFRRQSHKSFSLQ